MARFLEKAAERLSLPEEAVASSVKLTLTGRDRATVENHRGLLGYTETEVTVACLGGSLRIRGSELLLRAMDADMLLVTGRIEGVDLEESGYGF